MSERHPATSIDDGLSHANIGEFWNVHRRYVLNPTPLTGQKQRIGATVCRNRIRRAGVFAERALKVPNDLEGIAHVTNSYVCEIILKPMPVNSRCDLELLGATLAK